MFSFVIGGARIHSVDFFFERAFGNLSCWKHHTHSVFFSLLFLQPCASKI